MKASFHEIARAINRANRIAILSHMRPDCDAIGSQLALLLTLQQLGKEVTAWNEDRARGVRQYGIAAFLALYTGPAGFRQPWLQRTLDHCSAWGNTPWVFNSINRRG